MAALSIQKITRTGLVPAYAAAGGSGDTFVNDGATFLHVKNGSAGSINVTVNSQRTCDQGFDHDEVVAVGAGAEKMIGPFRTDRFNDTTTGAVAVSYSATTTVTVGAFSTT